MENNSNKSSKLNKSNKSNKLNNKKETGTSQTVGGVHYTYLIILVGVLILFFTFIFYERYFLPEKLKGSKSKKSRHEILLDNKNNEDKKGQPYHFKQNFGTTKEGSIGYDENDFPAYQVDKYFETLEETSDCNSKYLQEVSISMDIKFPYVLPNSNWKSSYKIMKPIVSFGSSPSVSYNPFYDYLDFNFLIKYASKTPVNKHIILDNIPTSTWINLILVIDNRKIKIYLNKKLVKYVILENIPILEFTSNSPIKFGEYNNNFNNLINKIIFYKRSLSTNEIEGGDY